MSNYERQLPMLFPYSCRLTKTEIREVVAKLMARTDIPALSSFAVQTGIDHRQNQPRLWLSHVSMAYLLKVDWWRAPNLANKLIAAHSRPGGVER